MNELITIVVPVYNVESYLDKCVESIVKQTYKNLEIILVDDGSTDNSGKMCDEWAEKDSRIKVIHKENGGLSDARNKGIDIATGKWIGFIDSDDYIDVTMFEKLYKACIENNCKISSCGFLREFDDKSRNERWTTKDDMLLDRDGMMEYLYRGAVTCVAWNKLYDITLFDNIRYPYKKIHEDQYTTYKVFCQTDKLYYISECLYYYYQRENSITGVSFSIKNLDILEALEQAMDYHKEHGYMKYYDRAKQEYIRYICEIALKNDCQKEERKKIDKILKQEARNFLKSNQTVLSKKLKLEMVSYCIGLYRNLGRFSRKLRGFQ